MLWEGDKAFCLLCSEVKDNSFSASGGSTGCIGNHLKNIHGKAPSRQEYRRPQKQEVSVESL